MRLLTDRNCLILGLSITFSYLLLMIIVAKIKVSIRKKELSKVKIDEIHIKKEISLTSNDSLWMVGFYSILFIFGLSLSNAFIETKNLIISLINNNFHFQDTDFIYIFYCFLVPLYGSAKFYSMYIEKQLNRIVISK